MSFRRKLKNKSAQKAEKLKTDLISQLYEIYITKILSRLETKYFFRLYEEDDL